MFVNHGAPVVYATEPVDVTISGQPVRGQMTRASHDGPTGHEYLQDGEQCECGQMKIGIRP